MAGLGAPLLLNHGSAITGRERDLIVGYEFDVQEGVLINKEVTGAGGGSDGTLTGASLPKQMQDPIHGRGLRFLGNSAVTLTNTGSTAVGTILMTARPLALGGVQYLFYDVVGITQYRIYFNGNVFTTRFGTAAGTASTYNGINGKSCRIAVRWETDGTVTVLVDGVVVSTYAGTAFANDIGTAILGASTAAGANGFTGEEYELKFIRGALTDEEIQRDYREYAKRCHYEETLRPCPVTAAPAGTGRVASSWWECYGLANGASIDIVDAQELERLSRVTGAKAFRCNAIGGSVVWIPTQYLGMDGADPEAAYGTFEFWLKKADGTDLSIFFISDSAFLGAVNGYVIRVDTNERLFLRRYTAGAPTNLLRTVVDYFPVDEWTVIRPVRRYDGRFTLYVNEIPIAAADIDIGTNPVTDNTHQSGSYFMAAIFENDEFALPSQRFGELL